MATLLINMPNNETLHIDDNDREILENTRKALTALGYECTIVE